MSEPTTGTERVRRSPEQIAQDNLNAAQTTVDKAEKRLTDAKNSIGALEAAVTRAKKVRDHAKSHPDLPEQTEGSEDEGVPES